MASLTHADAAGRINHVLSALPIVWVAAFVALLPFVP